MDSKERVLTTFAHAEADRVPINYGSNPRVDRRLKAHFGLAPSDTEGLYERLGVDFRSVGARYVGPRYHEDAGDRKVDNWGIHRRWIEHDSGGYWDYCDFPLRDADEETIANWPMPGPDDYDVSHIRDACKQKEQYAVHVGNPGLACIINTAGFLRGMEQVLIDLFTSDPAGLLLIDRRLDADLEVTRRILEEADGGIDFMWIGEDLGTQIAPLISMELFDRHISPRHQRFLDLAAEHDLPVLMHTCGSSSWAYERYIQMGLAGVDTLQPEATNMGPRHLKDTYGGRLFFHGCISTAGPVAYGSVPDVIDNCRETLEIMMPGGGYCFAPTHSLQDNSPTENVVAMYETAHEYGRY